MVYGLFGLLSPKPNAVMSIGDPCRWCDEQAPVKGSPDVKSGEGLTRLICSMGFVIRFEVDNRAWRFLAPLLDRRTEDEPSQIVNAVAMSALISDEVKPILMAKLIGDPIQSLRVHRDQSVMSAAENGASYSLPSFSPLPAIISIASQDPDDMVSAPTGDDVSGKSDEVFLGQEGGRRYLPQLPQDHGGGDQTVAVDGLDFPVKPLEEARVDLDSPFAHESGFSVLIVRKCPPLRADELNCRETLFSADLQVTLPILGLRFQNPVPGRIGKPEKGGPVGVHEIAAVGREFDSTVTVKGIVAFVRDTSEGTGFTVQATICLVGAFRLPTPFAQFIRAKPNLPSETSIPKGVNGVEFAG